MLISARISRGGHGAPAELLVAWLDGQFKLIVSNMVLAELERVLHRPKFHRYTSPEEVLEYVDLLRRTATLMPDPPATSETLTSDPNDDYLIALARSAEADVLISGDLHLTQLPDAQPPIMTPRAFLETLNAQE